MKDNNTDNENLENVGIRHEDKGTFDNDIDKELERVESMSGGDFESVDAKESDNKQLENFQVDDEEESEDSSVETDTKDNEEKTTLAPVAITTDSTPPAASSKGDKKVTLDDIIERHAPQGKGSKKGAILVTISVLLLLAAIALGVLYYLSNTSNTETVNKLRSDVSAKEAENQSLTKQLTTAKKSLAEKIDADQKKAEETKATDAVQYQNIPELGVRYKVTDQLKNVIYAFTPTTDGGQTVGFSTVSLSSISEKIPGQGGKETTVFPCSIGAGVVPSIIKFADGKSVYNGQPVSKFGTKVGDSYFVYVEPKAACSSKQMDEQKALTTSIETLVKALEVIPPVTTAAS